MRIIVLSVLSLLIIACEMSNPDGEQLTDTGTVGIADAGVTPAVDSGPTGAATTIAQIRSGTVASDSQVLIEDAVVTAVSPGRGFWIQQGSGPDSGLYVFGSEASETEGLVEGKSISLSGMFTIFNDLKQLSLIHISEPTRPY